MLPLERVDMRGTDFLGNKDSSDLREMVQGRTGQAVVSVFVRKILGLEEQTPLHKAPKVGPSRYMGMVGVELTVEKLGGDELVGLDIREGFNVARV
jgi:hypothetical protein